MAEPERGKREEFARQALPYMDQVYTAGLYLTRNTDEADELLQETFLRAYRFWHQFRPGTNCRAWLMTILHNAFRNRYRERYREQHRLDFDDGMHEPAGSHADGPPTNPEEIVLAQFLDSEVEEALKSLPVEFLEVVVLVEIQDLTYGEASPGRWLPDRHHPLAPVARTADGASDVTAVREGARLRASR